MAASSFGWLPFCRICTWRGDKKSHPRIYTCQYVLFISLVQALLFSHRKTKEGFPAKEKILKFNQKNRRIKLWHL